MIEVDGSLMIKFGTSSVSNQFGMDQTLVDGYTEKSVKHYDSGLIIVSSGSIAVGTAIWLEMFPDASLPAEQPLATMGSAGQFMAWQSAYSRHNIATGQVLASHREIDDSREGPMLVKTLNNNLKAGIVSIINENDAVSDVEIKKKSYGGDNDGLASRLARAVKVQSLILMTDVDGVVDTDKSLIRLVSKENINEACLAAGGPSEKGRGGMYEKVKAAHKAARSGIHAFIGHAEADIESILNNETGTYFVPRP